MDDSRAALITAYNAVRERYNKLRCQHRQLRKNQSCLNCQQKLNARLETENSANRQTWRSPSEANEIHAICDELKQIAEAGQVADSCCAIQSIIPRLENVASRMAESAVFDVQQESLMNSSALDMSSSAGDESFSQQVDADNDVNKTTEDLLPLKTSEVSVDDNTPWLSDLQQVADMATSQYSELKGVCQHLKQQNEALKTLVRQLVYGKDNVSDLDNANLVENDWSLLDSRQ